MLSLSKIALFSLISFATLALAIPAPKPRSSNTKALFTGVNGQLVNTMYPVACATPSNNTAVNIDPILTEVISVVNGLIYSLKESGLDCTVQEILELVADLLKIILDPLSTACRSNPDLLSLVGGLVAAIVELVQVVLGLVGPLVANLLALLIGNGCAGIIVQLGLTDLINCLGLGQTLGSLLSGL